MRTIRNIAIIALAALVVAVAPGGGAAAQVILTALLMGFYCAIGFLVYRLHRENQMTLDGLGDGRRLLLYGAVGTIALMIAGQPKMFSQPETKLLWFVLMGLSIVAAFRVWLEASRYG